MSGLITENEDGNIVVFNSRTGEYTVYTETIEPEESVETGKKQEPTMAKVDDDILEWFLSFGL